jgi:predicted 2-oxoglutarate/Fe(II)-dependent dioxygenase YbiX/peroxiredoxin
MTAPIRRMTVGDRAPNFLLEDLGGERRELYNTDLTGGPVVVLLLGRDDGDCLRPFAEQVAAFDAFGAHRYALIAPDNGNARAASAGSSFVLLSDADGAVSKAYLEASGLSAPAMFVLDPNQRIVALAGSADCGGFADLARGAFERIAPRTEPRLISQQAPVLFIPDVLDDGECGRLIDVWQAGEKRKNEVNIASGRDTSKGGRSEVKRRSDVIVEGALERHLLITLMPRLAPEIERVFSFDKEWGFEKFRIGCYEAEDAGFFRPHRDNPSEALSHRHFAASFNLNDGYEGGYLRFPEYGHDHYAPPKGGVLIFSCGLLHEVVPVTAGRRFTLLTFVSTRL